jgi:hypothetical protein
LAESNSELLFDGVFNGFSVSGFFSGDREAIKNPVKLNISTGRYKKSLNFYYIFHDWLKFWLQDNISVFYNLNICDVKVS